MEIKKIEGDFTICKVNDFSEVNYEAEYCFTGKTDEEKIGISAVSTFNTDYILVKKENEMKALGKLGRSGYKILTGERYGDYFMNRSVTDIMDEYIEQHDEWNVIR